MGVRSMKQYVADFETTVEKDNTRVWAWGFSEVGNVENFECGTNMLSFMAWCRKENKEIYFHNLKFDGEFIIYWLLTNGFEWSQEKRDNTFNTIISSQGAFYQIEVIFEKRNKKYKKVVFLDSYKKLPFSVDKIGKDFGLGYTKIEVEEDFYTRHRPLDHQLTDTEIEYLKGDVQTIASALGIQFEQELNKMTIGSDALFNFKKSLGKGDKKTGQKQFERDFPILPLPVDGDIRQAYRGGYTFVKEVLAGKDIEEGKVFDVNSLYPWAMRYKLLPYGMPVYYLGEYEHDEFYPLYIQRLRCSFRLKEGYLPMIQIKHGGRFVGTEYLKTSKDKLGNDEVELVLTSVDLELFFEHYDVDVIEWKSGWKFKACEGLFNEYIDYWMKVKETSTGSIKAIAKLMLNSLYGKFAKNPDVTGKYPYLNEEGSVSYSMLDEDLSDPVYTAMGCFITAWARDKTIRTAQSVYDRFIYADTDSIHLLNSDPVTIDVHPSKLGAWKHEGDFTRARFIRAKTYIEEIDGELHVTCAGMPSNVKKEVTWDNFHVGLTLDGKLMPMHVPGGIVLQPIQFTIS
jgi:hypothetical protein